MSNDSLDRDLARIVGNTRRKRRVVSIPDLAESIERASKALGGVSKLSERVILSPKMLRQFLAVQDLRPQVREMFEHRILDSVDLCSQLATLGPDDQIILAQAVASGSLQTKDVRDYRELRRRDASIPAAKIIEKVLAAKPRVEFLAEFILRSGDTVEGLREQFLKHLVAEDILRIDVDGAIVSLVLSQAGRDRLCDVGRKAGFTLEQAVQRVASGRL